MPSFPTTPFLECEIHASPSTSQNCALTVQKGSPDLSGPYSALKSSLSLFNVSVSSSWKIWRFSLCESSVFVSCCEMASTNPSGASSWVGPTVSSTVGPTVLFSGTPVITSEKLNGSKNYLSRSSSVELWFLGQGHHEHSEAGYWNTCRKTRTMETTWFPALCLAVTVSKAKHLSDLKVFQNMLLLLEKGPKDLWQWYLEIVWCSWQIDLS